MRRLVLFVLIALLIFAALVLFPGCAGLREARVHDPGESGVALPPLEAFDLAMTAEGPPPRDGRTPDFSPLREEDRGQWLVLIDSRWMMP